VVKFAMSILIKVELEIQDLRGVLINSHYRICWPYMNPQL